MRPVLVERTLGLPLFQTPTIGNDRDGPNPGRATSSLCPVWVFGRGRVRIFCRNSLDLA
jgi:hypothetical protein